MRTVANHDGQDSERRGQPGEKKGLFVDELVTDQGVLRVGADGVLEYFRDLDGHSTTRVLLWGCDAVVDHPGGDARVTLTVTRKRLPVVSIELPAEDRAQAMAMAATVRARARGA